MVDPGSIGRSDVSARGRGQLGADRVSAGLDRPRCVRSSARAGRPRETVCARRARFWRNRVCRLAWGERVKSCPIVRPLDGSLVLLAKYGKKGGLSVDHGAVCCSAHRHAFRSAEDERRCGCLTHQGLGAWLSLVRSRRESVEPECGRPQMGNTRDGLRWCSLLWGNVERVTRSRRRADATSAGIVACIVPLTHACARSIVQFGVKGGWASRVAAN